MSHDRSASAPPAAQSAAELEASYTRLGYTADHPPDVTIRPGATSAVADQLPRIRLDRSETGLSDLRLVGTLAEGGMGWIRLAEQRSLKRTVAIKSLRVGDGAQGHIDSLLHEGWITGLLEHPNIVPVHQLAWSETDGPVMVMKRVEGSSWRELLGRNEHICDDGEALERHIRILMDVCHAVHFAHSRGIVHRDIKPHNVMVGSYGEVYLLDWGIAARLEDEPDANPQHVVGTPAYMPPESVFAGEVAVSERTDIFLLGSCLHHVITGRHRNTGETLWEVLASASRADRHHYPPSVPEALGKICNRACMRDPDDRYPDAIALRRALEEYLKLRVSERSAARATQALEALRQATARSGSGDAGSMDVQRRFSACRFGFEQALADWPTNRRAAAGLQETLEHMFEYELAAMNAPACERLLADMDSPPTDFAKRLAEVQRRFKSQHQAVSKLAEIERQQRFHGADWGRTTYLLLNGITTMLVLLFAGSLIRDGTIQYTPIGSLIFVATGVIANLLAIYFFRRSVLDTAIFERLMGVVLVFGLVLTFSRVLLHIGDMGFDVMVLGDVLIMTMLAGTMAVTISPAFWPTTGIAVVGSVLCMTWPQYALDAFGVGYWVNNLYLAWVVRPQRA